MNNNNDNDSYEQSNENELIRAILYQKPLNVIENILDSGIDLDYVDQNNTNALVEAIIHNNNDAVKLLLDYGANPNNKAHKNYPLFYAIKKNNYNVVKLLLDYGAIIVDVYENEYGNDPLCSTIGYGYSKDNINYDIFKLLVDYGCDVNFIHPDGSSILLICVYWNENELVEYLLTHGANVNTFDFNDGKKQNTFYYACLNHNMYIAKLLLKYDVDYDFIFTYTDNESKKVIEFAQFVLNSF